MTTTDSFQKNPNFFLSREECEKSQKVNTNPRYKHFRQTNFTAGDEDQFEKYRDYTNSSEEEVEIKLSENLFLNLGGIENTNWEGYHNLKPVDIKNTFRYIFNKLKKGIFVKIKDNQLVSFLPFSKANFTNEWSDRIAVDPKEWRSIPDFLIYASSLAGYKVDERRINKFVNTWYANNFLLRSEFPTGEGDSGVPTIKDMLLELCKNRRVPDLEFFINRRDNPILKKDGTEPYESIWDSESFPLVSHHFEKYAPILSMVTASKFADVPIPTFEDWARISSISEGKFFDPCRDFRYDFSKPFSQRKDVAVFRGASTGEGTEIETNPRLKLAKLSLEYPSHLDAGITKWNTRVRKEKGKKYLTTINPQKLGLSLVNRLEPSQQAEYKYIVNVDGHVSAYRLSLELSMGSVILLRKSKYSLWFSKYLKEWREYVPIKEDLSDLIEKIEWCRKNENKCEEIAKNAKDFYNKYLRKDGIFDYLQLTLVKLKENVGKYKYNTVSVQDISHTYQLKYLQEMSKEPLNLNEYEPLKKVELLTLLSKSKLDYSQLKKESIYKNEKTEVFRSEINGIKILQKYSNNNLENMNGAFIGYFCINDMIKYIPNFMFTLDWNEKFIVNEEVEGILFRDWLSNSFNMDDYLLILLQLSLILEFAQNFCLLVHRDLYPWNIVIKKTNRPIEIIYPIFNQGVIKIKTNLYPVLIDYGKSRGMYKGIYYGLRDVTDFLPFQDCITILLSSLNIILGGRLTAGEVGTILKLSSIFYETDKLYDLRGFINSRKKYNEIVYGNTDLYASKSPRDLFYHILTLKDFQKYFEKSMSFEYPLNIICDREKINYFKEHIQEFIEMNSDGSLKSIYNLNLVKNISSYLGRSVEIKDVEWNVQQRIDIIEFNLGDDLFEDKDKLIELRNYIYEGELNDVYFFKIYMLGYIDQVMNRESKERLRELIENIDYKKVLLYLCNSASLKFYMDRVK